MKLRCLPEDFQVEEQTLAQTGGGDHALYRLTKRSIGTPEAIDVIVQRFQIPRRRLSYGGLKDRHAVTTQYLTIHRGPRRGLDQQSFQLEYVGQTQAAYTAASFRGNRFQLVLRNMDEAAARQATLAAEKVRVSGIPNYFDDQRFGSLGVSGEWIARAWCLGDYERALWLALADLHRNDSAFEKAQKRLLQQHWGNWPHCKSVLGRSHRRSVVTYLADKVMASKPADCRGAFARIKVDLRGLYLSAWQSALWNRTTSLLLQSASDNCLPSVPLLSGPAVFPVGLNNPLHAMDMDEIPLPSARITEPEGPIGDALRQVLAEEDIDLRQIRVKHPRDCFFSKGRRTAVVVPGDLQVSSNDDELHRGRKCLTLAFDLPRGSYATMLVKRLTEPELNVGAIN